MTLPIYLWSTQNKLNTIKKIIRSNIPVLSHSEIRRVRLPIYEAFYKELMCEGCYTSARYLKELVHMENALIKNQAITTRVSDFPGFLNVIIENVKIAETNKEDRETCLQALLQTSKIIDSRSARFSWLSNEFYRIMSYIMNQWDGNYNEIKSKILYAYGKCAAKSLNLPLAIEKLRTALQMAKGSTSHADNTTCRYLHQDITVLLSNILLEHAKKEAIGNPAISVEFAKEAGIIIGSGGPRTSKELYIEAIINKAQYLVMLQNHGEGIELLNRIHPILLMYGTPEQKCAYFMQKGICRHSMGEHSLALQKLKRSLKLSERYSLANANAKSLLLIGNVKFKTYNLEEAMKNYIEARNIFCRIYDRTNVKKANYLIGALKAERHLPSFINLLKSSDKEFCPFFYLRRWRNQNKPFWKECVFQTGNEALKKDINEIYCLMKE